MPISSLPRLEPRLLTELGSFVGSSNVLTASTDLLAYDCDGTTLEKLPPSAVVFVSHTRQVSEIVQWCARNKISYTARGAGTGLSGGALTLDGGILIELSRMNRILSVDTRSGLAVVEPGLVNVHLTRAVSEEGYYFAPDPSSQAACTLGGNVAENSGGPHTLKYGVTTNHILGLTVVLPSGEIVEVGGECRGTPGYDLIGLFVGSEGTLGIVTRITVRLMRAPQTTRTLLLSFSSTLDASLAVSAIIAQGIIPAALEMMDRLVCEAVEKKLSLGIPEGTEAVLLVEIDGFEAGQDDLVSRIETIGSAHDALQVRAARNDAERSDLWRARKGAFGAIGSISPSYYTHDGVIPRSKLPEVLARIDEIVAEEGLRVANVFHAGDGNLHPLLLFDEREADQIVRAHRAGEAILRLCVEVGGSLTGEHGIGFEKIGAMSWLFDEATLSVMHGVRLALNPDQLCNPGKAVPSPASCREVRRVFGSKRYA